MQAMEEMIARAGDCAAAAAHIVRGKRTKRQRLQAAAAVAGTPGGMEAAASSTSSAQFSGSTTATEEEEDMANCLILLARGCSAGSLVVKPEEEVNTAVKPTSRRFAEAATSTNGRAGFYVYECKTCSKCFPSFQALGGHRASHKKPKASIPPPPPPPMAEQAKAAVIYEDCVRLSMNSVCAAGVPAASASGRGSGKQRVHECSICGAEFISGQALGGHMRRHRPASHQESLPPPPEAKNGKRGLSLDLNLPAPSEDDDRFSFASKTPLLLSTSSLIDCHY